MAQLVIECTNVPIMLNIVTDWGGAVFLLSQQKRRLCDSRSDIHIHTYTCTYTYTHMHMCTCAHILIYIHTYMYTLSQERGQCGSGSIGGYRVNGWGLRDLAQYALNMPYFFCKLFFKCGLA